MEPDSQGMRTLSSASCAMQLHKLMLTIGLLSPNGRLDGEVSASKSCDWLDASTGGLSATTDRIGRADDVARFEISARTAANAKNTNWTAAQKRPDMNTDFVSCRSLLAVSEFVNPVWSTCPEDSRPYRSRRVIDCSGMASFASKPCSFVSLACSTFAMLVRPSHNSQPSQAFPLMPFPRIISAKISVTRARRQPFSKSSVGSNTANTP